MRWSHKKEAHNGVVFNGTMYLPPPLDPQRQGKKVFSLFFAEFLSLSLSLSLPLPPPTCLKTST
jgi:hypothetical protein